jgi:phosphoribosylglycinamide formyltransferase-1
MSEATVGLGIMASGRGSNAEALLAACAEGRIPARGALVLSNNPEAGVHDVAAEYGVPSVTVRRQDFASGADFADELILRFREAGTDLICLAGYMKKVPPRLIRAWPDAVLNIHPALLPAHGGKGMYGIHVHEDVLATGDRETGATVHYVTAEYDEGPVLLQRGGVHVRPEDTPETIAARVLAVEHELYPDAVRLWIERHHRG